MKATAPGRVTVIGSLNIDYIAKVDHLPGPGETVPAYGLIQKFGGKGANQAVAAARQGARVSFIGCLGSDEGGRQYSARLRQEGIDASGISRTTRQPTGTALIGVDKRGENLIIVAAGANGRLRPGDVRKQASLIRKSDMLLAQLEVPLACVLDAFQIANKAGVPCVLNPSPFRDDLPWGRFALDSLILNEGEARALLGDLTEKRVSKAMRAWRIEHLLVTCGARPTLCFSAGGLTPVPALKVKPVDTVGAGDAFAGAYAAWRAEGAPVSVAVSRANVAGALATLKQGAQESMPSRSATVRESRFSPSQAHAGKRR